MGSEAIIYALSSLLTDAPWYFVAAVPFRGSERFGKTVAYLCIAALSLLRALAAFAFAGFVPSGIAADNESYLLHPIILFAVFMVCFRVNPVKLVYTMLITVTMASSVNLLSFLVIGAIIDGKQGLELVTEPYWIFLTVTLIAACVPFVVKYYGGLLRSTFAEFHGRDFVSICAAPALFFVLYNIYILAVGTTYDNPIVGLLLLSSGLFCVFVNTNMLRHIVLERELNASNALLDAGQKRYLALVEALNDSLDVFVSYGDEPFELRMSRGIRPIA
jgi:hypothetical protein